MVNIPVLEGLTFTFFIVNSDFSSSEVKTIKKAAELMSDGIL